MTRPQSSFWTMIVSDMNRPCIHTGCGSLYFVSCSGAVVGLEQTFFSVSEHVGSVEICVAILSPMITCPVAYSFDVSISTATGSAGRSFIIYHLQNE